MGLIEAAEADERDPLDRYIEAHVHGPVHLARDIEALVLDPSYAGTAVEIHASLLPVRLEWHAGFRVAIETVRKNLDYRGLPYVELASHLAVDGQLTPAIIGLAAATGQHAPDDLKKVWHYLARFGEATDQAG